MWNEVYLHQLSLPADIQIDWPHLFSSMGLEEFSTDFDIWTRLISGLSSCQPGYVVFLALFREFEVRLSLIDLFLIVSSGPSARLIGLDAPAPLIILIFFQDIQILVCLLPL